MNWTIWKFPLDITDEQAIEMPMGARILSVQMQGEMLTLWAVVMPTVRTVRRHFTIVSTGHPADHEVTFPMAYLGTVQDHRGLEWHVFDAGEEVASHPASRTIGVRVLPIDVDSDDTPGKAGGA